MQHFFQQILRNVTCGVCGIPLIGLISVDGWGNRFCPRHLKEFPRCFACQRLITPRLTQGGVHYTDGRDICSLCRATAVDTKEQAKGYVEQLSVWCTNHHITFQNLQLKIDLVLFNQLNPGLPFTGSTIEFFSGIIHRSTTKFGGTTMRVVDGVSVLKGLPRQMMEGVFTHELGHAWLYLAQIDHLSQQDEEGFCNLLSYIYHSETGTPEAVFYKKTISENHNPVYGNGFRSVYKVYQKIGLPGLLAALWANKRMPVLSNGVVRY